jgi:hypothetical protein
MRAWLESATAGFAPVNNRVRSKRTMERKKDRKIIFAPISGMSFIYLDVASSGQVAWNLAQCHRLAGA